MTNNNEMNLATFMYKQEPLLYIQNVKVSS